jgi:post-segregation antitoxin (ccd killing protein)
MPKKPPIPEPPKRGAPVRLNDGKRLNVYLDAESIERARKLGDGNVSEGIRVALASVRLR